MADMALHLEREVLPEAPLRPAPPRDDPPRSATTGELLAPLLVFAVHFPYAPNREHPMVNFHG